MTARFTSRFVAAPTPTAFAIGETVAKLLPCFRSVMMEAPRKALRATRLGYHVPRASGNEKPRIIHVLFTLTPLRHTCALAAHARPGTRIGASGETDAVWRRFVTKSSGESV
jgi:hypothetical protein